MMRIRAVVAALVVAALVLSASTAVAKSVVFDQGNFIPDERRQRIEAELLDYESRSGNQIFVEIYETAEAAKARVNFNTAVAWIGIGADEDWVGVTVGSSIVPAVSPEGIAAIVAAGEEVLENGDEGDVGDAVEAMVLELRRQLGDDVDEAPDETTFTGADRLPDADDRAPVSDTPALDPAPVEEAAVAAAEESDVDHLGLFALGAAGVLLLIAIAARLTGAAERDVCPVCKSTLSFSAGEKRCGACGFRTVRARTGDTFFGSAAPAADGFGIAGGKPSGGASGSW